LVEHYFDIETTIKTFREIAEIATAFANLLEEVKANIKK